MTYGQGFVVQTPDADSITNVNWIRLGAVTHAFNQNQRINRLVFTRASGVLNVTSPSDPNLCPPGHYVLFILNGSGVPSVAAMIQISLQNSAVLKVSRFQNEVVISWPTNATSFGLEATLALSTSNTWAIVTNTTGIVGDQFTVTNNTTPGNKFYRLKQP